MQLTAATAALTPDARALLAYAVAQGRCVAESDGQTTVCLWEPDDDLSLRIQCRSMLSWSARARRFGVAGLDRGQSTGHLSAVGHPIPTDAYIAAVTAAYGDAQETRLWEPPRRAGDPASVLNALGAQFAQFCADGQWEPLIDPRWLPITEAATRMGISTQAIAMRAQRGQLRTWLDPREPNPRKARRVWLEDH